MRAIPFLCVLSTLAAQDTSWTTYNGTDASLRYSELAAISTANIDRLTPQWIHQASAGRMESTPLVVDGMMYVTGSGNAGYALDLVTGRTVWRYSKPVPPAAMGCCGTVNRGFAISGDRVFKVNFEGTLVALNARSGALLWESNVADYRKGFSLTVAPLVVKDKVIVGISGAEFGVRGYIDAYDVRSGERVWRFYTVAGPEDPVGMKTWAGDSWKQGGSSAWVTGSYDADLNLVYWGTGNPGPDMNGDVRAGDNLYSCSVVALDADTGKLKWYYQFTPHDVHDWDATEDLPLVDLRIGGKIVKAILQANRNGFYYALDRTNGKLLTAKPYTKVTWAKEIGADGRPVLVPGQDPTEEGNVSCPGLGGGHNWQPTSYSPQTGLHYFGSTDGCHIYYRTQYEYKEGQWYQLSTVGEDPGSTSTGSVIAVDPVTGKTRWRFEMLRAPSGGFLSTAGGLVFTGDGDGYLIAFDAASGKVLWKFQTGGRIAAGPVTYRFRGKQYVAVAAGSNVMAFAVQ